MLFFIIMFHIIYLGYKYTHSNIEIFQLIPCISPSLSIYYNSNCVSISIVMPVYNKYEYLNRSFDSFFSQTLSSIELIVVDDNSNDHSPYYVRKLMENDNRIKLIQHVYNQGICVSRIHGIINTFGEYIMTLDPDDLLYPNSSELSYNSAIALDADVVEFKVFVINSRFNSNVWFHCGSNSTNRNEPILSQFQSMQIEVLNWNLWSRIIKRSIYMKAIKLMLPFVQDKNICNSEDMIHFGAIFVFMKNFFCLDFFAYIYYYSTAEINNKPAYMSRYQQSVQSKYAKAVVRFFYSKRNNLENCTLDEFRVNFYEADLYRRVKDIVRVPNSLCSVDVPGFKISHFADMGYCVFER